MGKRRQEEKTFQDGLEGLENVVERLESGDLSLEDSLTAFEEGVRLVKFCNRKLSDVEKKIELLVKDRDGKLQMTSLEGLGEDEIEEGGK